MRRRHFSGESPRGPRRRRWQELRDRPRRGIFLLPSLLTTGNLFCGFLALVLTADGRMVEAAVAIFVAMVMDTLDGKVARLTRTTTQFGVEFDSLADVVSFCVAPAFMLYTLALGRLGRAAWLGAFLFVICGALRLARFNVHTGASDRRYFVGLPTPAAAGVVASVVLLTGDGEISRWQGAAIAAGTYIVALLMVSTFRYYSFKEIDFARRRPTGVLLVVVLGVLIVATHPQWFLFGLFSVYVLSGPSRPLWAPRREALLLADPTSRDSH
ncbi:MAG TPA: CDP-diacylglycerol--serine O-phosphatidyltransferase [Candidatus Methylomirabilis sp.]|nr:CDP-diacylglycerol--serine O-phosphatidyltransferase [Candidatus Methylomirabilis sp.]